MFRIPFRPITSSLSRSNPLKVGLVIKRPFDTLNPSPHSDSITTSFQFTLGTADAFLKILIKSSVSLAWYSCSHLQSSLGDLKTTDLGACINMKLHF
jgi:hypothetical protein